MVPLKAFFAFSCSCNHVTYGLVCGGAFCWQQSSFCNCDYKKNDEQDNYSCNCKLCLQLVERKIKEMLLWMPMCCSPFNNDCDFLKQLRPQREAKGDPWVSHQHVVGPKLFTLGTCECMVLENNMLPLLPPYFNRIRIMNHTSYNYPCL